MSGRGKHGKRRATVYRATVYVVELMSVQRVYVTRAQAVKAARRHARALGLSLMEGLRLMNHVRDDGSYRLIGEAPTPGVAVWTVAGLRQCRLQNLAKS